MSSQGRVVTAGPLAVWLAGVRWLAGWLAGWLDSNRYLEDVWPG